MSMPTLTLAEAMRDRSIRSALDCPWIQCCECGTVSQNAAFVRGTEREAGRFVALNPWYEMYVLKCCQQCLFWLQYINKMHDHASVRVAGRHYWVGKEPTATQLKDDSWPYGYHGRKFVIEFLDGRRVVTHNLWSQGRIADRFAKRLPDNAGFATGDEG